MIDTGNQIVARDRVGTRLVNGAAKKIADDFFKNFAANVAAGSAPIAAV